MKADVPQSQRIKTVLQELRMIEPEFPSYTQKDLSFS
jgi:hypothetical protein